MTFRLSNPLLIVLAAFCAFFCLLLAPDSVRAQSTLGAPTIHTVTPFNGGISFTWSRPSYFIQYYDLRHIRGDATDKSDDNWTVEERIWDGDDQEGELSGLTNGVEYDVQIRAVTTTRTGLWSDTATATPKAVPGRPTIDSLTLDNRPSEEIGPPDYALLTVNWSAPADIGGSAITSYDMRVFPSSIPALLPNKPPEEWDVREGIWDSGDLTATPDGLIKGVYYAFQVRAVNTAGAGPWSATVRERFASVPGHTSPWVGSDDGGLTIVHNTSEFDNGGSPITGYDARYILKDAPDQDYDNWTLLRNLEPTGWWRGLEYSVSGLTNGVWYSWQVRAINAVGTGPWSETVEQKPVGQPSPPVLDRVTGGNRTLTLGWHRPVDTQGDDFSDYTWCYIPSDAPRRYGIDWTCGSYLGFGPFVDPAYATYKITGLTNNVQYDVRVFWMGGYGRTADSNILTGTPRKTPVPPAAPAIGTLTPGDGALTVTWTAPADNGGQASLPMTCDTY